MKKFVEVVKVIAGRDRLYKPELFRKGDPLIVGVRRGNVSSDKWWVVVYNSRGERAEGLNQFREGWSYNYARKKAREFASQLSKDWGEA